VPVAYSYLAEFETVPWATATRRLFTRTRSSVGDSSAD